MTQKEAYKEKASLFFRRRQTAIQRLCLVERRNPPGTWFRLLTRANFTKNPNLPPVFGVVGQKDGLSAMMLPSLPECADIFKDFSFYLAPDAPHGVGLGTGTKGYVDYYTQIAQWPDMAVNFIESRLGLMEKKIDMDSVGFAW